MSAALLAFGGVAAALDDELLGHLVGHRAPQTRLDQRQHHVQGRDAPAAAQTIAIDHEEILCHDRIRVQRQLAPAFHVLLEEMTAKLSAT